MCQLLPSWCQRMMKWLYALLLEGNAYRFWCVVQVWSLHDRYCVGTGVFVLEKSFAKALSLDCETFNAERVMESFGSMSCVCKVVLGCIAWKLLLRNFVLAAAAC